jgi:hypothetical protein
MLFWQEDYKRFLQKKKDFDGEIPANKFQNRFSTPKNSRFSFVTSGFLIKSMKHYALPWNTTPRFTPVPSSPLWRRICEIKTIRRYWYTGFGIRFYKIIIPVKLWGVGGDYLINSYWDSTKNLFRNKRILVLNLYTTYTTRCSKTRAYYIYPYVHFITWHWIDNF